MSSRVLPPDDPSLAAPVFWPSARTTTAPLESSQQPSVEPALDLATVEREWLARVSSAREEGMREGEAAGRERATAELKPLMEQLARTLEQLAGARPRLRREAEADLVKLALVIARRVIRRELAIDPGALHGLVLGALERLQTQEVSRVRVHPCQAAQVSALLRGRAGCEAIEVVVDASGDPGTAVFETSRGNLDASVESQLAEIERGLTDVLERAEQ